MTSAGRVWLRRIELLLFVTFLVAVVAFAGKPSPIAQTLAARQRIQDVGRVGQFVLSPDGKYLVTYQQYSDTNPLIHLWEAPGLKLVRSFRGHTSRVTSVFWAPDSRHFYTIGGGSLFKWPVEAR